MTDAPARVAVIAWTNRPGRAVDLATALGGRPVIVFPLRGTSAPAVALRYAISALLTVAAIARLRPHAVVAQNPPVVGALIAFLTGWPLRATFVLDAHPGGLGMQGDTLSLRLRPITRWLARRAAATLVTDQTLADFVADWGATPLLVHEAPPTWQIDSPPSAAEVPEVLLIGTFSRDEPIDVAVEAAGAARVSLVITGDTAEAPAPLRESPPSGVRLTGYLTGADFADAIARSAAVLVLTTEPTSVPRAGYEAVRALRPLVISDTPATRSAFPGALHVANTSQALADALREVAEAPPDEATLRADRAALERTWADQLAALRKAIVTPRAGRRGPSSPAGETRQD